MTLLPPLPSIDPSIIANSLIHKEINHQSLCQLLILANSARSPTLYPSTPLRVSVG